MWGESLVAVVKAARALAVFFPVAHAEPAELEAALRARHVHAAVILLDGPFALGAGPRVRQNPVPTRALRPGLFPPLAHVIAEGRPVRLRLCHVVPQALGAELAPAGARHGDRGPG